MDLEALQSAHASCADIQRLLLLIAIKGSASADRKADIARAAQRIINMVEQVP